MQSGTAYLLNWLLSMKFMDIKMLTSHRQHISSP